MNSPSNLLKSEYKKLLHSYLWRPDESLLQQAYELGRRSMSSGLGCVDIARIHQDVLVSELLRTSTQEEGARLATSGSDFLAESLSSFEMTHRGYKEALVHLTRHTVELAALNKRLEAEMAERKKAEDSLRKESAIVELLSILASAINMSSNVESAFQACLDIICERTSWPLGHIWSVARSEEDKLVSTTIWHVEESERTEILKQHACDLSSRGKTEHPSRILASGKPEWFSDISRKVHSSPLENSDQIQLKTAVGFPIMSGNDVVAVLELFTDTKREPDERLIRVMEQIGVQLGRAVERQRLEDVRRSIPKMILDTQESERRNVARELHDDICQRLTALKMHVSAFESTFGKRKGTSRSKLRLIKRQIDLNIDSVRQLSTHLRPTALDDLGLIPALRLLCKEFKQVHNISAALQADVMNDHRFDSTVETALYRIAQEALTNVAKHAAASNVSVSLASDEKSIQLDVCDNGKGFDVSQLLHPRPPGRMLGTISMKERAELIGGVFAIHSAPRRGTQVHVTLPHSAGTVYGKD